MKKIVFIILILCSLQVWGQQAKNVYIFCKVKIFSSYKEKIFAMDYGNRDETSRLTNAVAVDTLLDKVNSFKNEILMLNYMNDIGWECFTIVLAYRQYQAVDGIIYYFRKPKSKD